MGTLRSKVIRLAHTNPDLRPHLLPLLKEAAGPDAVYEEALDNLADLALLSENAQDIIDGFNLHYASGRVAGMDPQIASEYKVLTKVLEGQKLADQTVKAMENLVKLFPEEKKYAKALLDAKKMHDKLTKQVDASKKIIRTVAKKVAPKDLTVFSKKLQSKLESRLIDPSQVESFFTQGEDWKGNVESFFVVKASVSNPDPESGTRTRNIALWIKEMVTGEPGLFMGVSFESNRAPYDWKPADVDGAVAKFLEAAEGWKNIKGEAEGQAARSGTAKTIASVLDGITSRLSWHGKDPTNVSPDFRRVDGAYRSNLPKEGAYEVGEYRYEEMVSKEIAQARKAVDAALAPYKDKIVKVDIHDGEKSWIYIQITLK